MALPPGRAHGARLPRAGVVVERLAVLRRGDHRVGAWRPGQPRARWRPRREASRLRDAIITRIDRTVSGVSARRCPARRAARRRSSSRRCSPAPGARSRRSPPTVPPLPTVDPARRRAGHRAGAAGLPGRRRHRLPLDPAVRHPRALLAPELAAYLTTGATVPHCCDQLPMYEDLVYATPGLKAKDIPKYFKDGSLRRAPAATSSAPTRRARTSRSCATRASACRTSTARRARGAMFGLGYAGAEDRLFFMDVLRHAGRGELSSFAGGANAGQDAEQWSVAPYTEAGPGDARSTTSRSTSAPRARRSSPTPTTTSRASTSTSSRPSSTRRSCRASTPRSGASPDLFKPADIIATAAMVGGIFGKGGGEELRVLAARRRARRALRHASWARRSSRTSGGRGPRGAGHRADQALPLPGAAEDRREGQRRAARPAAR